MDETIVTLHKVSQEQDKCPYRPAEWRNTYIYQPGSKDTDKLARDPMLMRAMRRAANRAGFQSVTSANAVTFTRCFNCNACQSLRILAREFEMTETRQKVLKINRDLKIHYGRTEATEENYNLFTEYFGNRFPGRRTFLLDRAGFKMVTAWPSSVTIRAPGTGQLLAAMHYQDYGDSFVAGLHYYDRWESKRRSLGTLAFLSMIQMAQALKRDYIYLGPWAKDSTSIGYKEKYYPLETFTTEGWVPFDREKTQEPPRLKNIPPTLKLTVT